MIELLRVSAPIAAVDEEDDHKWEIPTFHRGFEKTTITAATSQYNNDRAGPGRAQLVWYSTLRQGD